MLNSRTFSTHKFKVNFISIGKPLLLASIFLFLLNPFSVVSGKEASSSHTEENGMCLEFPDDIIKDRKENPYSNYLAVEGRYILLEPEYYMEWRLIADRKNRYSGLFLIDYLVCIQATDEIIQEIYEQMEAVYPNEYPLEQLLELCGKYRAFDKVSKEDILYEEAYGDLYYRTFPRTLTDYIGIERFDEWKEAAWRKDYNYGDTLPKCLDYFNISNEKFAELVAEGGFDYFFTPERLKRIAEMRLSDSNPKTGAC